MARIVVVLVPFFPEITTVFIFVVSLPSIIVECCCDDLYSNISILVFEN